ncbi:hypothetical protein GCM10023340_24290 [Nocardioides marinquilinus]|uniref:Uncharacterized protein n=1 Tax=Nocardioides marinquilinus TaxID=1210400 RepID=A0ABP9PRW6_9ACTN
MLTVTVAAPAHAGSWSAPDPAGDATSYAWDPEPEPCGTYTATRHDVGDLRRLSVRHGRDDVVLTTVMAGYDEVRYASVTFSIRTERRAWTLDVDRFRGRLEAVLFHDDRPETDEVDECGAAGWVSFGLRCDRLSPSADRASGRIRVVLPRSCLRDPRWVRAGVESFAGLGGGVQVLDAWEPRSRRDDDPLTPTYGPRVRRAGAAR